MTNEENGGYHDGDGGGASFDSRNEDVLNHHFL